MSQLGGHSPALRRERTQRAVGRVAERIAAWVHDWAKAETLHSQIESLGATLGTLTARLLARVEAIPDGEVAFAHCRAIDNDLAVVERLWVLFADGFGQRKDPVRGPILRAADEVVWSCAAMARSLDDTALPLPLAYLEPAYSASATPRIRPPAAAPVADRQIAAALRVLPIPLIGLPTTIVDEPWWLVLLAHEVGHHVQYDVEAGEAVVGRTAKLLAQLGADPGDAEAAARWGGWRYEVFADAFAVAALGPRALDMVAALEWDVGPAMTEPRGLYPPVVVRLALMAELAGALGFAGVPYRAAAWTAERADPAIAAMLDRTPAVAAALLDAPVGARTLRTMIGRASPDGEVAAAGMAKVLAGRELGLATGLAEPCRAIATAFGSWLALAGEAPGTRAAVAQALASRTLALVERVRDPLSVRRAAVAQTAPDPLADRVLDAMREAEREGEAAP